MRMLRLLMVVDRCVYFYQDQLSRERESRGAVQHVLAADKQTLRRRSFYPGNNVCTRCLASPKHVSTIPPPSRPHLISLPVSPRLYLTIVLLGRRVTSRQLLLFPGRRRCLFSRRRNSTLPLVMGRVYESMYRFD